MTLRLGTAVLRTRMTGGVGGGGSIPPPTRFAPDWSIAVHVARRVSLN